MEKTIARKSGATRKHDKIYAADLQRVAIIAEISGGKSVAQVARDRGLDKIWLSKRVHDPEFQAVFSEIYSGTIEEAKRRLPSLVAAAFDVLEKELASSWDPKRRTQAAKAILNVASRHWQPLVVRQCNCQSEDETVIEGSAEGKAGLID